MLILRNGVCALKPILLAVILIPVLPLASYAQGKGREKNLDKKCAKFVNCHDASDGRWDGRGPAATQTGNPDRYSDPNRYPDIYRDRRDRNRDRDDYIYRRTRDRRMNRDRDRDDEGNFDRHEAWRRRHERRERAERRARRVRRHDRNNTG